MAFDSGLAGVGRARVELTFEHSGLLSGSVGGQPVRVEMHVLGRNGRAAGMMAGMPVSASWGIADNSRVYPDVPASLTGSFAGQPVEVQASFRLGPGYFFDRGTVTGHVGGEALEVGVEAAGLSDAKTVTAAGTLGSTGFAISASVSGSLTSGDIRGTVAGAPLHISAASTRGPGGGQTRLTGSYQGPAALLALTAGAFLHFI